MIGMLRTGKRTNGKAARTRSGDRMAQAVIMAVAAVLAVGVAGPAEAQKREKPPKPLKLSKPVQSLLAQAQPMLVKAQEAQAAGDEAGAAALAREALPLIDQAAALPEQNAQDKLTTSQLRLNAGLLAKDNAQIIRGLEDGLASGLLPAEDQAKYLRNIGALSLQANDNAKAMQAFEQLMQLTPDDPQLLVEVAELQRRNKQSDRAVATLQKAIAAQEAGGAKADESWYRRVLAIAYDAKLGPQVVASSEALLKAYPNPTNWRDVLVIFRESGKFDDQANLDILRLMRANKALTGERDFAEYADTAMARGFPGEANAVLDEGIAAGALDASKPYVKELKGVVSPKVKADRSSLPALEKESRGAANGRLAMGTADAYLGYGDWAKAAEMYKLALSKGGVDADAANTRLAMVLGKAGDKAGAEAALSQVTGGQRAQLAKYYAIWLGQQG